MMAKYFLDEAGNYYEATSDVETPDGHSSVPQRPNEWSTWNGSGWDVGSEPLPTQAEIDAELDALADEVMTNRGALRAFALVVLEEINTLRAFHSLDAYTPQQLRTAVRGKINQ